MTLVDGLYFRTKWNPNLLPNTSQVSEKKIVLSKITHQKHRDGNRKAQTDPKRASDKAPNDSQAFAHSIKLPWGGNAVGWQRACPACTKLWF